MASTVLCLPPFCGDQAAGSPGHTRVVCTEECCKCFAVFRLDEALSHYFGEGAEVAQQEAIYPSEPEPIKKCPQCNKDMVLKTKKSGGSVPACAPPLLAQQCQAPLFHFWVVIQRQPAVGSPHSGLELHW